MKTNPNIARSEIAKTKADAADCRRMLDQLARGAAAPIDRVILMLAATYCQTAARHLSEAYQIVRDYSAEPLDADNPKGDRAHASHL